MTTEQMILQAIAADPDNDLPRQLLADWYDEQGDAARADLIRYQLASAAIERQKKAEFWISQKLLNELTRWQVWTNQLLNQHRDHWKVTYQLPNRIGFVRGLPEHLSINGNSHVSLASHSNPITGKVSNLTPDAKLPHWFQDAANVPFIRQITLFESSAEQREWLPVFSELQTLRLVVRLSNRRAGWATIASLPKLVHLELHLEKITGKFIHSLARENRLLSLCMYNCQGMTDISMIKISKMTQLQILDFGASHDLTDSTIKRLAKLTELRSLNLLGFPTILGSSLKEIATLPHLHALAFHGNLLSNQDLTTAFQCMQSLQVLQIQSLDPIQIACLSHLPKIQKLNLA